MGLAFALFLMVGGIACAVTQFFKALQAFDALDDFDERERQEDAEG